MSKLKKKLAGEKLIQYDLFTGRPIEDEPRPAENEIIPLEFKSYAVRAIEIKGEVWFVLVDLARVLAYGSPKDAGRCLRDKHKGSHLVRTPGGEQEMTIVNEAGLYRLMMKSKSPEAEDFQDWITDEVLPTIRRTGTYTLPSSRAGKWKRRLKCDDATAKKRVDQVDINKRTHSRIFTEKGGVSECASWHNAAYAGQFGDEVTAGKLRTDLEIPKWDTPLNHMGLVPLSVNHLGKAITEQAIADSKRELSPDEQVATLKRVTRAISKDTITQLGHEAGSDYVYGVVHKSKRGMIIDTVQKQLTAQ
jgi:prophage antirepressor-like protein